MCNVKMGIEIEKVKINKITYVSDTCLKRGNRISWSAIQEDKRHIKDNKVTYLVEVNNSYRKEVTFEFCQVTTKLTNNDNIRRQYTEVVMEDIDGEFGKIICTTSDVKNATTTLKNKMTVEYRKTLEKRAKDTKELKNENELLNKRINEKEQIEKKLRACNAQDKLEISLLRGDKVILEGKVEEQSVVIEEQKDTIDQQYETINYQVSIIEQQRNEIELLKNENKQREAQQIKKQKAFDKGMDKLTKRTLFKLIGILYSRGATMDEIEAKVEEYLNH